MILLKIIYGILLFGLGIAVLKYRKQIYDWTGRFDWAEKYLGSGGTVLVIILTGMLLLFLGAAYPFGFFDGAQIGNGSYMGKTNFNQDK